MSSKQQSDEVNSPKFGQHYAVLNLDLMSILIDQVKDTNEGEAFISNCCQWVDAVHHKDPRPPTIFTSLYFSNPTQSDLPTHAPFTKLVNAFGNFNEGSPEVQIAPHFKVDDDDIVLRKTRWYAGAGNNMEEILKDKYIDTVIISGLSLSGAVVSTIYRLFDLDYNIYVISDNVVEIPPAQTDHVFTGLLSSILPKMNLKAISLAEALTALHES
ncbi:Fc.00g003940.m01.CDS01 [Cosmosporella sp. VM-42]